ncbi:MAG: HEAT repeat domain-containing protein [Pseudomonadota bacterium]
MKIKETLRDCLSKGDYDSLVRMAPEHGGKITNGLMGFLSDPDEGRKWQAVKAIGLVTARLFSLDPERAKKVIRQLIWNLNEESGGIGWGMPEAFGEILAVIPALQPEYTGLLVAYISEEGCFIENEEVQKGVIWGLGRLKNLAEGLKAKVVPFLLKTLKNNDPSMQGLSAWALGEMGVREAVPVLKNLQMENRMLKINTTAGLQEKLLHQWTEEALTKLTKGGDPNDRERMEMQ